MKATPNHSTQAPHPGRGTASENGGLSGTRTAAVITAHPDDETLWAGGTILMHPEIRWTVVSLCRKSDPDRAPKFSKALACLGASGGMGDIDDGSEQAPLEPGIMETAILALLGPGATYDVVLTHSPFGEYTRHRRHEETGLAVSALWEARRLRADEIRLFAYDDGNGSRLPEATETADRKTVLPGRIFEEKYRIITGVYGFNPNSWEARVTPRAEAFFCFRNSRLLNEWYERGRPT